MLTPEEVEGAVRNLWERYGLELPQHDRVRGYVRGDLGKPRVPKGAREELKELARMSVKNVLPLVEDAFTNSMQAIGFRSPSAAEDAPVWELWQRRRMDARQGPVHRAMVRYGTAYVIEYPDETHVRSPRNVHALYNDPHVDLWPEYALEVWVDRSGDKPEVLANLLDRTHVYPVSLGGGGLQRATGSFRDGDAKSVSITFRYDEEDAYLHEGVYQGEPVCPVVRFVNDHDAEDVIRGEIEPLIVKQRALNAVNYDRLVVSRFGAFRQKYAIGWTGSASEVAKASAAALQTFDDPDVKVGTFDQSPVEPYNALLEEMMRDIAMTAQLPPFMLTGDILNIAAEAAAILDAPYQRKSAAKRESAGESWEQWLRLAAEREGLDVPDDAEIMWESMDSRSFGAIVDGITKLTAAGADLADLVDLVPGMTQQRVDAIRRGIRRKEGRERLEALRQAAQTPQQAPIAEA